MSFLDWFSGLTGQMSADMAIDLGTANTLVAITGEGIVINEPSVVAIEKSTQRVLAVGHEAKNMINHTPDAFSAEHPLKDGVIADYDVTEAMISAFINKAAERKYPWQPKPRIVVCIPCGATSVEKRAVFEATIQAGARLDGGLEHGALLNGGGAAGDAHDDAGLGLPRVLALGRLVDEGRDHGLGHIVVGDDAVFERVLGGERVRRVVDHVLGLMADGQHALSGLFYGDNGGLVDDDALPRNSNKGIGSAQIDGHVRGHLAGQA